MIDCMLPQLMASLVWTVGDPGILPNGLVLPEKGAPVAQMLGDEKTVWWSRLDYSHDTENFSIQWREADVDPAVAEQIAQDMESAWRGLIDELDWQLPTTADAHLITVVLDAELGVTGLTYAQPTDAFPMGVPIIYIDPSNADLPEFMASLCAHEFAHALQFRWRDWYSGDALEPWFWEASAEWQAELAVPDADMYAWSSTHYAAAPQADHFSMEAYHQYGMFLLLAYLDEYEIGSEGVRDLWETNESLPWLEEIEVTVGMSPKRIWAHFAGAFRAKSLRESDLYTEPLTVDGTTVLEGWLGHHYIWLGDVSGFIALDQGVGTVVRDGDWQVFNTEVAVPSGSGDVWLVVTNPTEEALDYSWRLFDEVPADTGDFEGDDDDDVAEPDSGEASAETAKLDVVEGQKGGCACDGGSGAGIWWTLTPWLVIRRRRAQTS